MILIKFNFKEYMLKKRKFIIILLVILALAAVSALYLFNQRNIVKAEDYISEFFNVKSYGVLIQSNDTKDITYEKKFFTKDIGIMTINNNNEVTGFDFRKQKIYKNYNAKWELFNTNNKFTPGSAEDLLNIAKDDLKINQLTIKPNNINCNEVNLNNNCVVLEYNKDPTYQLYFSKDKRELKLLKIIDSNYFKTSYYFTKINDNTINVLNKFNQMSELIKKDILKN